MKNSPVERLRGILSIERDRSGPVFAPVDRENMSPEPDSSSTNFGSKAELALLRELCDETAPRERRLALIEAYSHHTFVEPEHQVIFESIAVLLPRGPISAARLGVHLTNRGFPDIDVQKYIPIADKT